MTPKPYSLLAFDPGPRETGWALVEACGSAVTFLDAGMCESKAVVFRMKMGDVDVVAIERARIAHLFAGGDRRIAPADICEMMYVTGVLVEAAEQAAPQVITMTAGEWRKSVCRKSNASDREIKVAVQLFVRKMPKRSNEHTRDALGLALAAAWRGKQGHIAIAR